MVKLGFEIYLISKPMLFPQFFKEELLHGTSIKITWVLILNSELLSLAPKLLNQNLSQ